MKTLVWVDETVCPKDFQNIEPIATTMVVPKGVCKDPIAENTMKFRQRARVSELNASFLERSIHSSIKYHKYLQRREATNMPTQLLCL